MRRLVAELERHQVAVYLGCVAVGAGVGWVAPGSSPGLGRAINPVLGILLYATFLQVPVGELVRSLRDGRFLGAVLAVNFVVVPLVVAGMSPFLPGDQAIRVGVLLVLLCPCVDYVIVFSGLAGGSSQRLLAATPLLLIAQLVLLPLFLLLFLGGQLADVVEVRPFLEAFLSLIVVPLALAWVTQRLQRIKEVMTAAMVPLMGATLFVVVASQVPRLNRGMGAVVPFYILFLLVMAFAGDGVARLFRLATGPARALVFSGATRNSLVVLPLALALPAGLGAAPAVVVTQTLVEVVGMVVYVRLVPRFIADPRRDRRPRRRP